MAQETLLNSFGLTQEIELETQANTSSNVVSLTTSTGITFFAFIETNSLFVYKQNSETTVIELIGEHTGTFLPNVSIIQRGDNVQVIAAFTAPNNNLLILTYRDEEPEGVFQLPYESKVQNNGVDVTINEVWSMTATQNHIAVFLDVSNDIATKGFELLKFTPNEDDVTWTQTDTNTLVINNPLLADPKPSHVFSYSSAANPDLFLFSFLHPTPTEVRHNAFIMMDMNNDTPFSFSSIVITTDLGVDTTGGSFGNADSNDRNAVSFYNNRAAVRYNYPASTTDFITTGVFLFDIDVNGGITLLSIDNNESLNDNERDAFDFAATSTLSLANGYLVEANGNKARVYTVDNTTGQLTFEDERDPTQSNTATTIVSLAESTNALAIFNSFENPTNASLNLFYNQVPVDNVAIGGFFGLSTVSKMNLFTSKIQRTF